jgi:hypothetical protein
MEGYLRKRLYGKEKRVTISSLRPLKRQRYRPGVIAVFFAGSGFIPDRKLCIRDRF